MKETLRDQELVETLERLDRFATFTDGQFRIPLTKIRFGFDSLFGLVPVIGDLFSLLLSLYLLREANKLGLPTKLQAAMIRNTLLDFLIGLVPIIGDVADVGFRTNLKNLKIIVDHVNQEVEKRKEFKTQQNKTSNWLVLLALTAIVVIGIGVYRALV